MKLYDLELNSNRIPQLVEEKSFRYSARCNSPDSITDMLNNCFNLCNKAEEHVYLIALDTKANITGVFLVSKGVLNYSICNSREILQRCFMVGAASFVIAHNHPSGDCTPSRQDIRVFDSLKEAGKVVGIDCLDSIIVTDVNYCSIREMRGE